MENKGEPDHCLEVLETRDGCFLLIIDDRIVQFVVLGSFFLKAGLTIDIARTFLLTVAASLVTIGTCV